MSKSKNRQHIKDIKQLDDIDDMDSLEKAIVTIALLLIKTSNKQLKRVLREYKQGLDSLRQELSYVYMNNIDEDGKLNMSYQDKHIFNIKIDKSIKSMTDRLTQYEMATLNIALYDAYRNSYYETNKAINKSLNQDDRDIEMLDNSEIERIINQNFKGDVWQNRVIKNSLILQHQLQQIVRNGINQEKSIKSINDELTSVMNSDAYKVERLLDTEIFRVHNLAILSAIAIQELSKVRYSAVLDSRTCEECSSLDDEIFYVSDAPNLPMHSNCRCMLVPHML